MPALSTDRYSLTRFLNLTFRFDVKRIVDSGQVSALETDATGTIVYFNRIFKDIDSITASVRETTDFNVVIDFLDVPNPVSFKVYVFNSTGVRASKTVFWIARGVS
jgi:hypothetical protein